ncbi:MAG: isocitrate lyase/PEP mutase family protein [Nocardioidaceae bacterium]
MTAAAFRAMHEGDALLVLPNVWDVVSARAFADAGFGALATASTAIAATLGHEDGERTPREEMFEAITRIAGSVDVPVSADIEAGYGLAPSELVARLLEVGVVGCNLEDTDPLSGELKDARQHASWLHEVCAAAGSELLVNARVDVYLRGGSTSEAIRRGRLYREAGAGCVYPIFAPASELEALVTQIGGPINVHPGADGPSFAALAHLGVRRVTFGGGLHSQVTEEVRKLAGQLREQSATQALESSR